MLSPELNERITRVGPGTPMGELMRRYWVPALLSEEVPAPDAPPVRVRLLGEDLVAFRDSRGEVGVVEAFCPHRRAPMFFGRNEEAGLRCVYHGWKFDTAGNCVDLPSEPPDSPLREKVNITAYPTFEGGGIVWAYLGPRSDMPEKPDYEWLRVPDTHYGITRSNEHCNYLQAVEGGIDTAHSSFVHNNDLSDTDLLRSRDTHPELEVTVTDYGFTYAGIRHISPDEDYIRAYQFIMPFQQLRARFVDWDGSPTKVPLVRGHLWVPMDDYTTAVYNFAYSADQNTEMPREYFLKTEASSGRGADDYIPGTYWLRKNPSNDYLIDREVQRTQTYTGIVGINTQDYAVQEGMGPICDRSKEHLGTSDKAIIRARRLLLDAIDAVEEGRIDEVRGRDPLAYRMVRAADKRVPSDIDWHDAMKDDLIAEWA